jgi:ribulose-phosphate 3-epimerase
MIPRPVDKIKELSTIIDREGLEIEIEVDGNIGRGNIPQIEAGARTLVAWNSFLSDGGKQLEASIERLYSMIGR